MRETHSLEGDSWIRWMHEIRRMEFEGMMEHVFLARQASVLELGCGDGFQLELLNQRFDHVFAIDPQHRPARLRGFSFAAAESLPFPDRVFDLVVSNCVLEHLEDRRRGIAEAVRVLRPGGYMAHVVPSRFWKAASLLFNPLGYPLRVAEKWWALRHVRCDPWQRGLTDLRGARRPGVLQVLGRWVYPPTHGTYPSHRAEYESYARQHWLKLFTHPRLALVAEARLPCATQFGFLRFRWVALRSWLGRHGLNSSRAFILRRIE